MFKKRIASLALAGVMAASLAVPAFAAGNSTTITGSYREIPIAVTVPDTGAVTINPYGLPVSFTKSDDTTKVEIVGQQITTAPLAIMNDGSVDLSVGATVTTTVAKTSGIELTTATTVPAKGQPANTEKQAFVYLEIVTVDPDDGDAAAELKALKTTEGADINDLVIDACAADVWGTYKETSGKAPANMLALNPDEAVSKSDMGVLKAAKTAAEGDTPAEYDVGSVGLFRLSGDCVTSPDSAWSTKDSFTTTIAFTFTPSI